MTKPAPRPSAASRKEPHRRHGDAGSPRGAQELELRRPVGRADRGARIPTEHELVDGGVAVRRVEGPRLAGRATREASHAVDVDDVGEMTRACAREQFGGHGGHRRTLATAPPSRSPGGSHLIGPGKAGRGGWLTGPDSGPGPEVLTMPAVGRAVKE